jgi:prepilin-type processing-associated H-X9-DG protein
MVDSGRASSSTVPLLCDSSAVGTLAGPIGAYSPAGVFEVQLGGGELVSAQMVGQPVYSDPTAGPLLNVPAFSSGTSREGANGWWAVWNKRVRQDYRAMNPLHRGVCNVLMADGSVQALYDANGDQFINNGFPAGNGFASSDIEAGPLKLASYYSLQSRGGE